MKKFSLAALAAITTFAAPAMAAEAFRTNVYDGKSSFVPALNIDGEVYRIGSTFNGVEITRSIVFDPRKVADLGLNPVNANEGQGDFRDVNGNGVQDVGEPDRTGPNVW